ncbi:hypothetical protein BJF79_01470 [Actinomadura sp. CNU-125]|nr:hypothetical protein BJF79_01470 [Actinomadura sp. CNU-125]
MRQRMLVEKRVETIRGVERVEYETKREAYERFKKRFEDFPQFEKSSEVGDIPDGYRVWLRPAANDAAQEKNAAAVQRIVQDLPGVQRVTIEVKD